MGFSTRSLELPTRQSALPGRNSAVDVPEFHFINGNALLPPFPDNFQTAFFAMGCFWGAERIFWQREGVYTTAVGYAGGLTPNPTYEEVCSGMTGHTEVVLVVWDPQKVTFEGLLELFWKVMTLPKACARETISAASIARPFTQPMNAIARQH